jgi:hypothetical protein
VVRERDVRCWTAPFQRGQLQEDLGNKEADAERPRGAQAPHVEYAEGEALAVMRADAVRSSMVEHRRRTVGRNAIRSPVIANSNLSLHLHHTLVAIAQNKGRM